MQKLNLKECKKVSGGGIWMPDEPAANSAEANANTKSSKTN
ncbi:MULTISPECIES: hypothetical protein [unclassified Pseudoalteromonas]|nr:MULTISPECIES: hypothetical protein [unclassified Pseudoalteromonas]MCX2768089.1 hypothetical protein [Pseudoalteromonas sp. B530]